MIRVQPELRAPRVFRCSCSCAGGAAAAAQARSCTYVSVCAGPRAPRSGARPASRSARRSASLCANRCGRRSILRSARCATTRARQGQSAAAALCAEFGSTHQVLITAAVPCHQPAIQLSTSVPGHRKSCGTGFAARVSAVDTMVTDGTAGSRRATAHLAEHQGLHRRARRRAHALCTAQISTTSWVDGNGTSSCLRRRPRQSACRAAW